MQNANPPIGQNVRIGHVHLKVADLDRALDFYCGVLGFELIARFDDGAAFISAGGYHHHIGLNTWESLGGSPPPPGTTGLYHLAILYPTRAELSDGLRRLIRAGISLDGASDHGVSEATCAIQIKMVWNSVGIAPLSSGRTEPMGSRPLSPDRSISTVC